MKRRRHPTLQLYRPQDTNLLREAAFLLQRADLKDEDVLDFLNGKSCRNPGEEHDGNETLRRQFHERRHEIRELKEDLGNGRAMIDDDDRLVPIQPQIPGPEPPIHDIHHPNNIERPAEQVIVEEQREATESVAHAVAQYREQGVAEGDFELIVIPPRERGTSLQYRICFAFVAVVCAFAVFILQTLPSVMAPAVMDPYFDELVYELAFVRHVDTHLEHCPGLRRDGTQSTSSQVLQQLGFDSAEDCGDGVLHIPAKHVIVDKYLHSSTKKIVESVKVFKDGFNMSWTLPCVSEVESSSYQCHPTPSGDSFAPCDDTTSRQCFRGVHDGILSDEDVSNVLDFGNYLVEKEGSDNFKEVLRATYLKQELPEVVYKVKALLRETYNRSQMEPFAFRIVVAGPFDGYGVQPNSIALNKTSYFDWVEKNKRINEFAYDYPPWLFNRNPVRDTCLLLSDNEVDPRFSVHTSLFLGNGAGRDYRGGSTLFMDDHVANYKRNGRIRRGLSVDGSHGRVVVSSSGIENRRCRLPVRAGLRKELQIWWNSPSP
eukprot:scaffold333_cov133-Cylindrotheca_fusiformis.AAC.33